jgi:parvulin-like peptidyl-prolyl isomerase
MRYPHVYLVHLLIAWQATSAAVVLDRVAVVVGLRAVKTSDIDRDLRASQFLNRQKLDLSDAARKRVAERLAEQELIRQEIRTGRYSQPTSADVDAFLARIRQDRFGGSDEKLRSALAQYGLTPEAFREYLRFQLMVLRFIDERFRPGVLVTDEDVKAYYDEHRAELVRENPKSNTLEALTPKVRDLLTGERVNEAFEEWLNQVRRQTRVQYLPAAFGGAQPAQGATNP